MPNESDTYVESCERCMFALIGETNANLERPMMCRRFPPQTTAVVVRDGHRSQLTFASNFPAVAPDHWCGEFEAGTPFVIGPES